MDMQARLVDPAGIEETNSMGILIYLYETYETGFIRGGEAEQEHTHIDGQGSCKWVNRGRNDGLFNWQFIVEKWLCEEKVGGWLKKRNKMHLKN